MTVRKPPLRLQTTTLWDYPSQHYGDGLQGDPSYVGATPSYVLWNLLTRYTRENDLVVDPFCGSGTTLDVCRDLGRAGRGFDVAPYRADIEAADARALPLPDASVDFVFMDPPYADNVDYSDDPRCIGKLSADDPAYFEALGQAYREAARVLRPRRYMAVYLCDFYSRSKGFVPIGARTFELLCRDLKPIEHVCVVRHNKALKQAHWHRAAAEENFFLRGFNHLFIMKSRDTSPRVNRR
jgi:SAM-dependent methyltransferase